MSKHAFVIPWRDRGRDELRPANLDRILRYLESLDLGPHFVVSDGRSGDENFCRHIAYNRGGRMAFEWGADVVTFYESDMLCPKRQLEDAIDLAALTPGLVVPFTEYRYLTPEDSELVRQGIKDAADCVPEYTMANGKSIGAINTLSKVSIEAVGQWDEVPDGNGYDDNIMEHAFKVCCGPTRHVEGPASHLFHRPGWYGLPRSEVTDEDRAATERNRQRWLRYRRARTPEQIRRLTSGG